MRVTCRESCRLCGGAHLELIYDFGSLFLTGIFPHPGQPEPSATPLELVRCKSCHLVQLRHTVDGADLYSYDYGYRSGVNATMRKHLADLAADIESRVAVGDGDLIADIAANDGTLLASYSNPNATRFGIDPIVGKFAANYRPQDLLTEAYFSADAFREKAGERKAKAVTSISIFYDIEDPVQFARDVASILAPDGIWVLEQSYLPSMIERNSFDTICQEHLSYFAFGQIAEICARAGLKPIDVTFNDINGGSFRVYVAHRDGPLKANEANIRAVTEKEARLFADPNYFQRFCARVEAVRHYLKSFIDAETAKGKMFYIYGASTKGSMIIQYCGIGESQIAAAADRNPEKWGRRMPGANIPIVSEEEARQAKPDYFLVLPWHFKDEFLRRERTFLESGGKFVFPLPQPTIVDAVGSRTIEEIHADQRAAVG